MPSHFLFAACQTGSEAALKQEVARLHPSFRFAFSRPGFCTFRISNNAAGDAAAADPELRLHAVFARTSGFSLGKVAGTDERQLARDVWSTIAEREPKFRHLHVWQRDGELPGDAQPEPGGETRALSAGRLIVEQRPNQGEPLTLNEHANAGDAILDCVIVEPNEWWLGRHVASAALPETRWPGGVPNLTAPPNMISRAYLKMSEALAWSELPVRAGDRCVEIGSAPGGACRALLERGCTVIGVDPAEMDATVLADPRFTHVRARAKDAKRSVFHDCRWLMADANVAPSYTLDTVEPIVADPSAAVAGLLLTLKITDEQWVPRLPSLLDRIRAWGYRSVRARQLAYNRQEVCVAASSRDPSR